MRFNFKKITAILMSALAISGTVLPAVAANKQFDTSIATEDTLTVEPRTGAILLSTKTYSSSIIISWNRPSEAVKYYVTCGGQAQTINSTALSPSATFLGLSSKTTYIISVIAYNSSGSVIARGSTSAATK